MTALTFKDFAQDEFQAARKDLEKAAPQEVLARFYRRLDDAVTEAVAQASTKPACRAGCSYCCNYKVVARAIEVVAIHQYVIAKFSPDQIKAVMEKATRNVEEAKGLSDAEHFTINQRCPFLLEEKCAVYPVRPAKCRSYHASNVDNCKQSYEHPTDLTIPNSYILEVFNASSGISEGFNYATREAGFDSRTYDLNSAFLEAMTTPGAAMRLKNKKKVFVRAKTEKPQGE